MTTTTTAPAPQGADETRASRQQQIREAVARWIETQIGHPPKFRPVAEGRMAYARHGDYTHAGQRPVWRAIGVGWGYMDTVKKRILCYFDWLTEEPSRCLFAVIAAVVLTTAAARIPVVGGLVAYLPVLCHFDVTSWF